MSFAHFLGLSHREYVQSWSDNYMFVIILGFSRSRNRPLCCNRATLIQGYQRCCEGATHSKADS